MFIFDPFKRSDRHLQVIACGVLAGMFVLLAGLWYVQIVSATKFKDNLQKQSFRSVRISAIRGKIFDRNEKVLADNQPRYNVNLYLEELLDQFTCEYTNHVLKEFVRQHPGAKITLKIKNELLRESRYRVASNMTYSVTSTLGNSSVLDQKTFFKHYNDYTYVPFPILQNLTQKQVALFAEQFSGEPEIEPLRNYPNKSTAAHLLGYVRHRSESRDDEKIKFQYPSPYYVGDSGLEAMFDSDLRGTGGAKRVLINNMNYRQREELDPTKPGRDVYLTINLAIQNAAEKALGRFAGTRGAAVVMDVRNGDILAMASAPTYNPNDFVKGISSNEWARLDDKTLRPMYNRATHAYTPGSIFKIVTAIACFESGLDPKEEFYSDNEYRASPRAKPIGDTAGKGFFYFERAFYKSSNTYFITNGLTKAGVRKIFEVGKRFHLGERTELLSSEESSGSFPSPEDASLWVKTKTPALVCIGQDITVTPVQMAAFTAAIANGGKLFWPRVVSHLKSPDSGIEEQFSSPGRVRETVHLNPQHLEWIRHAMLMDTEHPDANAYKAFHQGDTPYIKEWHIAGKTGTAQIIDAGHKDRDTWFVSFGPYETPRYAVVVMVEGGGSGGGTCAPIAEKIYEALLKSEQTTPKKTAALAQK